MEQRNLFEGKCVEATPDAAPYSKVAYCSCVSQTFEKYVPYSELYSLISYGQTGKRSEADVASQFPRITAIRYHCAREVMAR